MCKLNVECTQFNLLTPSSYSFCAQPHATGRGHGLAVIYRNALKTVSINLHSVLVF